MMTDTDNVKIAILRPCSMCRGGGVRTTRRFSELTMKHERVDYNCDMCDGTGDQPVRISLADFKRMLREGDADA